MWPQLACQDVHYNDICNLPGSREAAEEGWEDGGTMGVGGSVSGGWQQSGWPRIFPPPGEVCVDDVLSEGLSPTNHMVIWGWNIKRWGHELPWAVCRDSGKRNILSFIFIFFFGLTPISNMLMLFFDSLWWLPKLIPKCRQHRNAFWSYICVFFTPLL